MDKSLDDLQGYLLDGEGSAKLVHLADTSVSKTGKGPIWVHLDYTNPNHQKWIQSSPWLNTLIKEALLTEETRPRVTPIDTGILVALRGVNLNPGAEPDDMVAVRLWIDERHIISTKRRDLLSINDLIEQLTLKAGPCNSADFLVELIDRLVWRMNETLEQFEDRVADLEERVLTENSGELRYELALLRRQIITIRRYLAPEREALGRLLTEKVNWISDSHRLRLREINDRLIRHIEDLDAVRERAAVTQEELLSRLSEQINSRMYVLSIVAALFLPLSFLTGLLGINVGGIPGAENPQAFLTFSGFLLAVILIQLFMFRLKKWF